MSLCSREITVYILAWQVIYEFSRRKEPFDQLKKKKYIYIYILFPNIMLTVIKQFVETRLELVLVTRIVGK